MSNSEENKDKSIADANKSTPFDSEEQLDLEIEQEEKKEDGEGEAKSGFNFKTIGIALLLLLPIIFILYKTMGSSKPKEAEAVAQQDPQVEIAAYENAANTNPTYENYLNLSNVYIRNNLAGRAIAPLEKAIALKPEDGAAAYNNLGFAYTIVQQYKNGIKYCQKAVDIDTSFTLAKNNLNWAKSEYDKVLAANAELDKMPEEKKDAGYYILYGLNYLKLQEYEKSIDVWNNVFKIDPKNIAAMNNIGVSYMSLKEIDKAIEVFTKATVTDPNDNLSKANLNWALEEKKTIAQQKEEAKQATGVASSDKKSKK